MVASATAADTPPPASNGPQSQAAGSPHHDTTRPDAWSTILLQIDELREYFSYYIGARTDQFRARVRKLVIAAVLIAIATVAAATFAATAAALVLVGLGAGLGEALGGKIWLGNFLVGTIVLVVTGLGGLIAMRCLNTISRNKTIRSYAERRERQRRQFGRDVSSRAKAR